MHRLPEAVPVSWNIKTGETTNHDLYLAFTCRTDPTLPLPHKWLSIACTAREVPIVVKLTGHDSDSYGQIWKQTYNICTTPFSQNREF